MAKRTINYKMMVCTRCGTDCQRKSATQVFCKTCSYQVKLERHKIRNTRYLETHPRQPRNAEIDKVRRKKWLNNNKEKRAAVVRAYNDRNRDLINAKFRERLANPEVKEKRRLIGRKYNSLPKQRLDQRMGQGLRSCLRRAKAGASWESLLGYTLDDLMKHLEKQFVDGMSWANMSGWDVDHIVPKILFKYQSPADPEFKAAWAMSNLRPLWAKDNRSKHAKRTHLI